MIRPPATAWLDNRWNVALDLASEIPVSPVKVAAAWEKNGPDQVLAKLRELAGADDQVDSGAA